MKTKTCKQCQKEFPIWFATPGGKRLNLWSRSYCLECSPFGTHEKNKKPIIEGKRQCLRCKLQKPLDEFTLRNGGKNLRSCCRQCETIRTNEYSRTLKQKAVDYLGGKCFVCGYNRSLYSLVFHHKNPAEKSFSLSRRQCLSWEVKRKELDKCVLLCANCHGEVHDGVIEIS